MHCNLGARVYVIQLPVRLLIQSPYWKNKLPFADELIFRFRQRHSILTLARSFIFKMSSAFIRPTPIIPICYLTFTIGYYSYFSLNETRQQRPTSPGDKQDNYEAIAGIRYLKGKHRSEVFWNCLINKFRTW